MTQFLKSDLHRADGKLCHVRHVDHSGPRVRVHPLRRPDVHGGGDLRVMTKQKKS